MLFVYNGFSSVFPRVDVAVTMTKLIWRLKDCLVSDKLINGLITRSWTNGRFHSIVMSSDEGVSNMPILENCHGRLVQ